ncbi:MAG: hypothetical protein LBO67_04600 [Spirochaetaceae bacterium]|jgi:hypothetical protein|nr:hypothetical protein [Spirochaetaceae bacterium]
MKLIVYFVLMISLFGILSCGVSKQDYAALKAERDALLKELDLYQNGESRLAALIEQNIENEDFSSAKENLTALSKYHPESIGKPEISRLVTLIENEEARIARMRAEKEESERIARLERQKGFENTQAANARVLTVAEADLMKGNRTLTTGNFYIIHGYFYFESGGRVTIRESRKRYSDGSYLVSGADVDVKSDRLLKLTVGTPVSILARANEQSFELIEWQRQ